MKSKDKGVVGPVLMAVAVLALGFLAMVCHRSMKTEFYDDCVNGAIAERRNSGEPVSDEFKISVVNDCSYKTELKFPTLE